VFVKVGEVQLANGGHRMREVEFLPVRRFGQLGQSASHWGRAWRVCLCEQAARDVNTWIDHRLSGVVSAVDGGLVRHFISAVSARCFSDGLKQTASTCASVLSSAALTDLRRSSKMTHFCSPELTHRRNCFRG